MVTKGFINKKYWTKKSIFNFINRITKKLNGFCSYDSIIFNITCHGYKHYMISSDEQLIPIYQIQNLICSINSLNDLPKLFVVDCCRDGNNNFKFDIPLVNTNNDNKNLGTIYGNVIGKKTNFYENKGSYFIYSLSQILKQNIKKAKTNWTLSDIMRYTKEFLLQISENYQLPPYDGDINLHKLKFKSKRIQFVTGTNNKIDDEYKQIRMSGLNSLSHFCM